MHGFVKVLVISPFSFPDTARRKNRRVNLFYCVCYAVEQIDDWQHEPNKSSSVDAELYWAHIAIPVLVMVVWKCAVPCSYAIALVVKISFQTMLECSGVGLDARLRFSTPIMICTLFALAFMAVLFPVNEVFHKMR